jgi:hypothetical protein
MRSTRTIFGTRAARRSQSTISRLENAPSKTDAARLTVALVDHFATTVTPGRMEMFTLTKEGRAVLAELLMVEDE